MINKIEILFDLFIRCNSDIHSHMPKHTPRQFYKTSTSSGMRLRSGKTINCVKTTEFGQDYDALLRVFNMCKSAMETLDYNTTSMDLWMRFYPEHLWGREYIFLKKMNGDVHYSVDCTINFTLNNFLKKWRKTVNEVADVSIRELIMEKLEENITELEERLTWPYYPSYCACHDIYTQMREETIMDHFIVFGQGYMEDGLWHFTPSTVSTDFRAQWHEKKRTWSHSLPELNESLSAHLRYFKRIPHRNYMAAYFTLASSRMPETCSLNIISFL